MKMVELIPGVRSSVLGFGCAPVLGSIGPEAASVAIRLALDLGINHFDVAPSYGYGEAEEFIGRQLKGRRSEVVIATKFGIEAHPLARSLRPVKSTVRSVVSLLRAKRREPGSSGSKPLAVASRLHRHVDLTASGLQRSVEGSLRKIQTDYVDYLLLHEPKSLPDSLEELVEAATDLKRRGILRGFGISADWETLESLKPEWGRFDILQFQAATTQDALSTLLRERANAPNILFSPRSAWVGREASVPTRITTLVDWFPRSIVLCSMFDPDHLQSNAAPFSATP